jgi:hypothetical protein
VRRLQVRYLAAGVTVAILAAVSAAPAQAAPAGYNGEVRITITAPAGVPASIGLVGWKSRQLVTKPPGGTSATTTLSNPAGLYWLELPRITFDGAVYTGIAWPPIVPVTQKRTTPVTVRYVREPGSSALHVTALSQTTVDLAWASASGSKVVLRRTAGSVPAATRTDGVGVPVAAGHASDTQLSPGQQYSYSLFTQYKNRWYGPLSITVGTASDDTSRAAYVAPPSTALLRPTDTASAVTTGNGVQVVLAGSSTPTPLVGAGVVLPVSPSLPGGFLGVVTAVSADGRTLNLAAGGLSDAFDYYDIDIKDFSAGDVVELAGAAPSAKQKSADGTTAERARGSFAVPGGSPQLAPSATTKAASDIDCGGSGSKTISFQPSLALGGHFKTKVDKYSFLGAQIPTGASIDVGVTATVTGAATV